MDTFPPHLHELEKHLDQAPDTPCLVQADGVTCPSAGMAQLLRIAGDLPPDAAVVLTALSNHTVWFNPFAGLVDLSDENRLLGQAAGLVALLGSGRTHRVARWPDHLAVLTPAAARIIVTAGADESNALDVLEQAGGEVWVCDAVFASSPGRPLVARPRLRPHEEPRPAAWDDLRLRLDEWLHIERSGTGTLPGDLLDRLVDGGQPVTLHVTHSWGGGVGQWVDSFIAADEAGLNLQLRAEGPQSGQGCGQRLSLYLGNHLVSPIARWWLQPPVRSTESGHPEYRELLGRVTRRFGVGRVIVSSLVGHTLEALSTGLPTVQVVHDFYPRWPLLGVNPEPYLQDSGIDLAGALQSHRPVPQLADLDASRSDRLSAAWRETVTHWGVRMAAPSRSVADLLRAMDPGWRDVPFEIVPHGLPKLPRTPKVAARPREDGRLRLLIPGRMQEGKGQQVLLEALPALTPLAQVCLLGAGKGGEAFFGISGVDVILQYDRDRLPEILENLGPDLAALLSVVPETFSYTLSEMQQLGIPVVASRVGALAERISDGDTGWLISPTAEGLVRAVQDLADDRGRLQRMRDRLADLDLPGCTRMVRRYAEICAARPAEPHVASRAGVAEHALADLGARLQATSVDLREALRRESDLKREVRKRTDWAEEREQARRKEVQRRERWVARLQDHIAELGDEIAIRDRQIREEQENHQATIDRMDELQALHDWVLSTRSWRFTRPFRAAARAATTLRHTRAWNPLRWPFLISRLVGSLRTRGLRGTLNRTQSDHWMPYRVKSVDTSGIEVVGDPEPPASVPFPDSPTVSVVIPVHNKWEYTAACLRSLVECRDLTRFEVIVVDDQSTDETPSRLERIEGVVALRNEENLGFVGSCNRGAGAARGEYVLMLNNDTQVTDGWLDEMLRTFDSHPDTGIVGARLVYPDGRLQEAGGIVFNDGSGWNYGKFDDPERTDYQFLREADYCSGACIMLPAGLFRELGGFDPDYAPAYYEDTDLAFKVREKGLKVRIQPAATIIHHEGITSGTDLSSGAKRYQDINRKTFCAKWAHRLADQPSPIVDPRDSAEIRAARDHHCRGRVLVIDAYTPEPNQDSGSVRLCYLMQCLLDLGYRVSFLPDNRSHAGHYTRQLQKMGIEALYEPWVPSLHDLFSKRGSEFDFVFISRYYVAENYLGLLRRHCPNARFIFDTVDLHFLREERLAELENSLALRRAAAQTRRAELAVINAADTTLVVSPVEKTLLAEAAPDAAVTVISNIHEVTGSQNTFAERKDIFFVGGYQHPPNIDAAQWFVSSIWPLIRKELPDLVFHLVGSKAPESVRALDGNGVRFHGFVESLDPWLDGCRMAVAPLRYGAGIKGKVNMSMARGQPVVATPMAVEGMFARPGKDVLVAETEEAFAAEVVRLYRDEDLWNRISQSGLENVQRYFSVETARLGLQELLKSLK